MKVTGFSFIRNAVKYDYPIVEAITSVLPLCDEFVIAVGNSDDATLDLIKSINSPKIRIIETVWDDSLHEGGAVLAAETDKAYAAVSDDTDWAFYIQGDEVVHEKYLPTIRSAMEQWNDNPQVDGLLFNYLHFFGSYDYVGNSPRWYRNEIRIIRKNRQIYSYRDAQGFRKNDNKKLNIKPIDAYIYHYGWVKHPDNMRSKIVAFNALYNKDIAQNEEFKAQIADFDYSQVDKLARFNGTHPQVMLERIKCMNWAYSHDLSIDRRPLKYKFKMLVEKLTGYRIFEYKNYNLI
jgi:hypothetical protein